MRLLLVATELPTPTRGGSLCLHRLLRNESGPAVEILTHEREAFDWPWPVHRARRGKIFYKYWHSRFGTRLQQANRVHGWELPLGAAARIVRSVRPDFLLTVAYGPALVAARKLSKKTGVPLVTLFMDWWPDLACNHLGAPRHQHATLDREFRQLHEASRVSFHFSREMQNELGFRTTDQILYPAVGEPLLTPSPADPDLLAYAGLATGLYAESLTAVVHSPSRRASDRLELMGPGLPSALIDQLPEGVSYHGFLSSEELTRSLTRAGALLVVLPFDEENRRLARTSFSSKFADYCRLGRPIIIWGPADAAIVRFAVETGSAETVTTPDAAAVWNAFEHLKSDHAHARRLITGAAQAYETHFAPGAVRTQFIRSLEAALSI
jgi:hypothetical protein